MKKLTWKEIRENKLHISQEELAKKLGITRQAYSMKEKYIRKMKIEEAILIAKLSSVKIEDIKLQ